MKKIILKTWFETGLGDFYTCLFATKVCFDFLKTKGYDVKLYLNTERYYYGKDETLHLLNECFNLEYFGLFFIDTPIPKNFNLHKRVENCFDIYVEDENEKFNLDNFMFYQYSCEKIFNGNPYPLESDRKNIDLLSLKFKDTIKKYTDNLGEFECIFLRYPDSKEFFSNEEKEEISKNIENFSSEIENYYISSKIFNINDIKINNKKIKFLNFDVKNNFDRVYRDLLNMCIFHKSKKIHYRWYHWSNYLTFSLIHNTELKSFNDFFHKF